MKQFTYRDRDYTFGQAMLTLRTAIGLTQVELAKFLGVSRRAVGEWEAGSSYPKAEHFKQVITLAVEHQAFQAGHEADEIYLLWQSAHQKMLLDEAWLTELLVHEPGEETGTVHTLAPPVADGHRTGSDRKVAINLPFQPTQFIGRSTELAEIARILADPACRLLTLLGPGGVGKTRLTLAVAAAQTDVFTDGVAFVTLPSMATPNHIVSAIGDTLNLSLAGRPDPTAYLLDYLRERHMLLVLDSVEHLLEGVDLVRNIVERASHVTILVTSRARLNLQAEWLFNVEGLAYPQMDAQGSVALDPEKALTDYGAIQLFVQRATQVQPELPLTEETLVTIGRICQYVAGMPLAIELAAAGMRSLPMTEIERQIRSNLDVLATTLRDVPARHGSMRAVFDQSWNLLSEQERALLSRLAVFRDGFTAEAAWKITGATLPALTTLLDKSLLRQADAETRAARASIADEPRFVLLEPVREYAWEKVLARGEAEAMRRAHATYYLALAEAAAEQWDTLTVDSMIRQLNREHDNMSAALQWSRDGGDHTVGLQLAGALWRYWRGRGHVNEGRAWLAELLALDDTAPDQTALAARLRALHGAAWLASDQHDFAHAAQLFEQSMALRRAHGETENETNLLLNAALQARAAGQYQRATALLEDTLSRHRALGDRGSLSSGGMGLSLYALGLVHREQGNFARAVALFETCRDFHREIGEREGIAQAQLGLSDVARDQGDTAGLRKYCEQGLAVFREFETQWAIGFALNNLAQAAYLEGDLPQAFALVSESASVFHRIQNDGGLAEVLITLGQITWAQGDETAAHKALTEALRLASVVGPRLLVAAALEALAVLMAQPGQAAIAVRLLGAASALRAQMGTPVRPSDKAAVERALATARSVIDPDAFAAAWSAAGEQPLEAILNTIPIVAPFDAQAPSSSQPVEAMSGTTHALAPASTVPRVDWGDALAVPTFYGREWELNLLTGWVVEERCRVVSVLGLGGIGKSALAVTLMHYVAEQFKVVIWRSLRDIPSCEALLDDLLQVLAPQALAEMPASLERRQSLLLELMRSSRVLLVLDNLESVLEEGEGTGHMRPGYEGFGRFLRLSAQTEHQSCVLLTSREKPADLVPLEGNRAPVRTLRLARLNANACEQLLAEMDVTGAASERARLIEAYAGNPLALKIVAQTIIDLFDGEIAPFLEQGEIIFGGVRDLLNEQFNRLSPLEQRVLLWLAISREPMTLDELMALWVAPVQGANLLEAVDALHRRSLIERGQRQASFTLQSVVLEYVTARLITEASDEIREGRLVRLIEHGLEPAQASEYVRQIQERLIVAPILAQLRSAYPQPSELEKQLLALLDQLATRADDASDNVRQGYGPANLVMLVRLLRGHLRGLDLSRLALRSAHLQGVEMQDATLAGAMIRDSIFTQTFDALTAVAISSAGEYWAAASRRGEIRVWNAGGQTLLRMWQAHTNMIYHLTFSPNRRTLASGGWDGGVKMWDLASGALLWSGQHTSHVNNVAFAPDGSLLASSGDDATVRIWEVRSGTQLQVLPHPGPVSGDGVTWNPALLGGAGGFLLASGDLEGYIRLWEIPKTGPATCVQTIAGHANWVDGLAFSPDGSTLASASFDGTVKLWEMPSGRLRQTLTGHTNRVFRVAWSPDGRILASCSFDQTIWLWDVAQGSYRAALRGHTAGVVGVAFTPDSRSLLSGSEDGTLRVWDVSSGQCLRVMQGYAASVYDVDWSPDGTQLVSGGSDALVTVWDVTGGTPPRVLRGHSGVVIGVGWSPDGRWLASSEWDNSIRLWDPTSGACLQILKYPEDAGNFFDGLAWSPDGQRLACGTYRHGMQVFDLTEHRYRWSGHPAPTWIRNVAWSVDGAQLAGGGDDGTIYVWNSADGRLLLRLAGHHSAITSVAWSPNGTRLVSGGGGVEGGELFVWDAQGGERVVSFAGHPGIVYAVAWGPSEEIVVSGSGDGTVRWWDVQSGECMRVREAHQGIVQSLRRSPDGTKLASCGDDGAIMIWDLHSGEYLQTLRHDRPYERLNISGIKGLTEAQKATLRALGAVD